MLNYLDKLRKKPEPERRKAVLWISIWVTLVIALVWGAVTAMRIASADFSINADTPTGDNTPSLADTFSNFFHEIDKLTQSAATGSASTTP